MVSPIELCTGKQLDLHLRQWPPISNLEHHLEILKRGIAKKFGDGNGVISCFKYHINHYTYQRGYSAALQMDAMRTWRELWRAKTGLMSQWAQEKWTLSLTRWTTWSGWKSWFAMIPLQQNHQLPDNDQEVFSLRKTLGGKLSITDQDYDKLYFGCLWVRLKDYLDVSVMFQEISCENVFEL